MKDAPEDGSHLSPATLSPPPELQPTGHLRFHTHQRSQRGSLCRLQLCLTGSSLTSAFLPLFTPWAGFSSNVISGDKPLLTTFPKGAPPTAPSRPQSSLLCVLSHVWPCDPTDCSCQVLCPRGFSRQGCCSGLPFPSIYVESDMTYWLNHQEHRIYLAYT